jgi:hypothetical protein
MPIMNREKFKEKSDLLDITKNHANSKISLRVDNGIGKFYE